MSILYRSDELRAAAWASYFAEHAPDFAGAFGRVPVTATVDGIVWATSVWREREGRWLLPVPKKVRRGKADGDHVTASLALDTSRL